MSAILRSLIGATVKVYSGEQGGYSDEGVLEDVDEFVLVLRTKSETLFFPLYNVRLVKLVR